jgi:hypothetical protein
MEDVVWTGLQEWMVKTRDGERHASARRGMAERPMVGQDGWTDGRDGES